MRHKTLVRTTLILFTLGCLSSVQSADKNPWEAKIAMGVNLTSGNSDTTLLNTDVSASRKTTGHEFKCTALFAYGETDGNTTEKNGKTTAQYNWLFTSRTYAYLNAEGQYDQVANLDHRIIAGPGLGRYLIKTDKHALGTELGSSIVAEQKQILGEEESSDKLTLRVKQHYEGTLGNGTTLWQYVEILPEFDNWDVYLLNAECGIQATLSTSLSLRLSVLNKHDSDAAPTVEKNDLVTKASLVYTLR